MSEESDYHKAQKVLFDALFNALSEGDEAVQNAIDAMHTFWNYEDLTPEGLKADGRVYIVSVDADDGITDCDGDTYQQSDWERFRDDYDH